MRLARFPRLAVSASIVTRVSRWIIRPECGILSNIISAIVELHSNDLTRFVLDLEKISRHHASAQAPHVHVGCDVMPASRTQREGQNDQVKV